MTLQPCTPIDPRRRVFDVIAAGTAADLPVPYRVQIPDDHRIVSVFLGNDNPDAVDRWATWLDLPRPQMSGHLIESARRWFTTYQSETFEHPDLPGWQLQVVSYITVPAPVADKAAGVTA
ncbi:hypothetical protein [Micromonospora peucetia]|uniref:Uncharacterized protein n=1 Tax=Micromonospora peucetia TaxID=47871 RepID=A0A1C6VKX5_9ACTN|nr:hypothetical protein [Micromonospora peucetia]SCL66976.1 hypothetical protein GA0070608_3411 [Micromonospora peucetia]